ncbi:MAG: glycoside hydrolase family 5 protein [Prolixibacteraceae bacterium]|nr:glycoside hydrolase family 5 protein [Prolixibacteraceae bacterium]
MKQLLIFLGLIFLLSGKNLALSPECNQDNTNQKGRIIHQTGSFIPPDTTGMPDIGSVEFSKKMVPGWNVGNSLDAIGGETNWGNPKINQLLMDSISAAGFKSVRIPVAWSKFSDESAFTIQTSWLNRVEEVVNYVLNAGMIAVFNIHWDGGWMQPTYKQQDYVNKRLAAMWEQIAIRFRDYDNRVLFAGTNEVMVEGNYSAPTAENATVQNSFNQTFVNTVRNTGGRNTYRYLVVQGYNTNINYTVSSFIMPVDEVENRLMVEVHYYDPYNFALNENSTITQWGKKATDASKTETWANESYANGQFAKMKKNFVDKGFAVLIGEYGAISRNNLGSEELNKEHAEFRRYYIEYITKVIVENGQVPFYWDNGYTGNHSFGLFNRDNGAKAFPEIIQTIMSVCKVSESSSETLMQFEWKYFPDPAKDLINIIFNNNNPPFCFLFNTSGQKVKEVNIEKGPNSFALNTLEPGIYFLGFSYQVQKFLKNS